MDGIEEYFPQIRQTSEGFCANCPKCDDSEHKFFWNNEKQVGCCFHSECSWFYGRGGATLRRVLGFFNAIGTLPAIPEIVVAGKGAGDVALPEEFKTIPELPKDLRSTLYAYMSARGIPARIVQKAKIGYCQTGKLWGYFIFPVFNEDGDMVYFQARRFKNREPKFYNPASSSKSELIYRISVTRRPQTIILVESVMNALTLETCQRGKTVVIGLLGKTLSPVQLQKVLTLERHLAEIVVALDGDAKRESILVAEQFKHLQYLKPKPVHIRIARFPLDKDINALGREKAWQVIREAKLFDDKDRTSKMVEMHANKEWYFDVDKN